QVVRGVVSDVATSRPIPAATVILQDESDSAAVMTLTDDHGHFTLKSPHPGALWVLVRHVGNVPIATTSATLGAADTVDLAFNLNRIPTFLDTVKVTADKRSFFASAASHGSDVFKSHYEATNGIFVSAAEIRVTRLPVASFLSAIPGFKMAKYEPNPGPSLLDINNNAHRWLTSNRSDNQEDCVVARLDWQGVVKAFDDSFLVVNPGPLPADTIPYYMSVYDVIGIEVYRTAQEAPPEWRMDIPKRCALIQFWSKFAW
ncbi:MAG TPA: carboxypeptidase-like regulatory domain-containing protein, partial [Gemmatimonadaceae bacterium]|nr:carboxypeptidase-like regulatory domain-containing protein [Gemmatimonadaceae bacterium]